MHERRAQLVWMQRIERSGNGRGFLSLSLLATWAAGLVYNFPVFPYTSILLPSSRTTCIYS